MAIVRSMADAGTDYLTNFAPFVTHILKSWPDEQNVTPATLSRALCREFDFPSMPLNVAEILLCRAERRGEVVRSSNGGRSGDWYPDRNKLATAPDLRAKRQDLLAKMTALTDALVVYANEIHELKWTEAEASAALERLAEDFGAELALAKRNGGLPEAEWIADDKALAVVYAFARRLMDRNPTLFGHLEDVVQGTMIANAVYFEDVRAMVNRLGELRIYLDTTPLLRVLGMAPTEARDAAREMLALMNEFKVRMFVFPHTISEIQNVLEGLVRALRRGRQGFRQQARVGGRNREAIDALVKQGTTPGEIEGIIANLDQLLAEHGVHRVEMPPHLEKSHLDEQKFDDVLKAVVHHGHERQRENDLLSLAAIDRLRAGQRPRELRKARAVFITSNTALVRASRTFFRGENRDAPVAHCMLDISFTAQLWVRSSSRKPDLPRRLLIADCWSALNPSPELWERWVTHISKLKDRGEITDEQVQNLIYHEQAKDILYEVTHGDANTVTEHTVPEVLDRFERALRAPAEDEAVKAQELADASRHERDLLKQQLTELKEKVATHERWEKERSERIAAWIKRGKHTLGGAGVVLISIAFIIMATSGILQSKIEWGCTATFALSFAAGIWAWGTRRKPLKTIKLVLVEVGAVVAFFGVAYTVAPNVKSTQHTPRKALATPHRAR